MKKLLTLLIILFTISSCKNDNKTNDPKYAATTTINCFKKTDSLKIKETLNYYKKNYSNENIKKCLTKKFITNFNKFPKELFAKSLKNGAKPIYQIEEDENNECNTLAVYYNYIIEIIDDGEEYRSESSFILYLKKNNLGEILLDGFGAAG